MITSKIKKIILGAASIMVGVTITLSAMQVKAEDELPAMVGREYAEEDVTAGDSSEETININFGQVYTKAWTRDTYQIYTYNTVVVPERGVLNMQFSKPYDSKGEIGRLYVSVYDASGNQLIWNTTSYGQKGTPAANYNYSIGLAPGTYSVVFKPGFYVTSGIIDTVYKYQFTPTEYCELEPNESRATATRMKRNGSFYSGFCGEEDKTDYYSVDMHAGTTYKIAIQNFDLLESTTAIMKFHELSGSYKSLLGSYSPFKLVDEEGNLYFNYTAPITGTYYFELYNYMGAQIPYKLSVAMPLCAVHNFAYTTIVRQPSFSEGGIIKYTCAVCGYEKEEFTTPIPNFGWLQFGYVSYWYENSTRQGTYTDPKGVLGDGTVRGREIYDPVSNGWYWLDACYDGAKACSKEVWIPYIFQDEKGWSDEKIWRKANDSGALAQQVHDAIVNRTGKWVRYDMNGMMCKGWYTVTAAEAPFYPYQVGNTYYYDPITGLMAKGYTFIDGIMYHFDERTGVLTY